VAKGALVLPAIIMCYVTAACSRPNPDIIRETSPFSRYEIMYRDGSRDKIISAIKRFADDNEYRVETNEFGPDGFSAILISNRLNLIVVHHIGKPMMEVDGIVRGQPFEEDSEEVIKLKSSIEMTAEP